MALRHISFRSKPAKPKEVGDDFFLQELASYGLKAHEIDNRYHNASKIVTAGRKSTQAVALFIHMSLRSFIILLDLTYLLRGDMSHSAKCFKKGEKENKWEKDIFYRK